MNFNTFIGQKRIKDMLQESIRSGRLFHAYSFEGSEGMGKMTLAKAFAAALLCTSGTGDACGQCLSCRKFISDNHPDAVTIPDAKASISVDEIRSLQEQIIIKPIESETKVVLIDRADKMTVQAQNCLLKTLEDPPAYAVLVLCTANSNLMLRTIQSRCTRIRFDYYNEDHIRNIINTKTKSGSKVDAIDFAVAFSQGVPGKAFSFLSEDFLRLREEVITVLKEIEQCEVEELIKLAEFFDSNKDSIDQVLDIMTTWHRDIALYKATEDENVLINCDKKGNIITSILNYKDKNVLDAIKIIEETRRNVKMNANFQMAIDNMLLSIWEVNNGKSCRSAV